MSAKVNDRPFQDIKVSTKGAEGFFIGSKFSIVYAFLYAPFTSKEAALLNKSSRALEFVKSLSRATFLCCSLMTGIFAMRQHLYQQRDYFIHDLQVAVPFFRKNMLAAEGIMYFMHSIPLALILNFW